VIRDVAGRQNHSVKLARKLQHKKFRRDRGLLVCEGMDLLLAAVASGAEIRDVLVRPDLLRELPSALVERAKTSGDQGNGPDIGVCDEETMSYASSLGGAADVIFTCTQLQGSLSELDLQAGTTLFLDGVGDPGNVGTIVRSALAFGLLGVVCSPGTADPFGPKAMRAGMGSQFSLPVITEVAPGDLLARLDALKRKDGTVPEVWVADPYGGEEVGSAVAPSGAIIVLGAERCGPGDEWRGARRVTIPQGRVDSLNVAMAATVFAYESLRKRQGPSDGN
jgi:TrmH family RNA methyltransferase